MKKKNNNDELISRRQFFKKAAGLVLPAIALTALPGILTSCEIDEPLVEGGEGGGSSSGGSCKGNCKSVCTRNCASTCKALAIHVPSSCNTSCKGSCYKLVRVHAHERIIINSSMKIKEQDAGCSPAWTRTSHSLSQKTASLLVNIAIL